jgi:D-beta-D-heptose 7-phosphate kinase/D-beta-D-heptose 1-phosphate adenosyltransferase
LSAERDPARLRALVDGFAGKRILVVGDLMLDEYVWGKVSRISPEAPVPVVKVTAESYFPGGAANVARNIQELTGAASVMGLAGDDPAGARLMDSLRQAGIETSGVQRDAACSTTVKTRIVARNQQVVRVDRERIHPLDAAATRRACDYFAQTIPTVDAVVVADYGKGFLTQPLADFISASAQRNRKILAVDPHPYTSLEWDGATVIKPNRMEAFLAAELPPSDPVSPVLSDEPLLEAGQELMDRWNPGSLLITLGEQGMLLLSQSAAPYHISARAREVFDVSGAGDTAISVLAAGLAAGATPAEAAELANRASAIAVGKLGTATVTADELRADLSRA